MREVFSSIGLPEIVAATIVLALNAYVLMGGADFGGGVWDLIASGPRREAQRSLVAESIGPIWEANHVWLIVAVVVLFTGFPAAFGVLGTILHIPLTIVLVGIVLRGSAFVFRRYGRAERRIVERWGLVFSIASIVTPLFLGVVVGAISSDAVGRAASMPVDAPFVARYVDPWFAPYPIAVGFFALALFAMLAAVYSAHAARNGALEEDFRRRALVSAVVVALAAAASFLGSRFAAPRVASGITTSSWAGLLHLCTAIAALSAIAALASRRYHVARIAAAVQVGLILWGWALAQYPFMIPPTLTIRNAAAPTATLDLLIAGLVAGAVVLIPLLRLLFKTFSPGVNPHRHRSVER
jgi:cytochrome bd ubiquinol oxidase subunit II